MFILPCVHFLVQALTDEGLSCLSELCHLRTLSLAGADGLKGIGLTALQGLSELQVKAVPLMSIV